MSASAQMVCKICGSPRLRQRPFGYEFHGRWLQAWGCDDCGIIFIHPQPTAEELTALYSKEYFEGDFRCGHEGRYFDTQTLDRLSDTRMIREIKQFIPSGRFLEIGCAGGAFLNAARTEGYDVCGVEFSDDAAEFARNHFGLNVVTGDVYDARFDNETFDVVFLGDVLEHLPEPCATLKEIYRITTEGGLTVLACPTQTNTLFSRIGFMIYDVIKKKATVQLPPYHLFEYRLKSLSGLLKRSGFSVMRCRQTIIPPHRINVRGSWMQKVGKKIFQYPNYLITSLFGVLGDRIEVFARKQKAPAS